MGRMSENDQHQFKDRYMLRLPDGMRDRIKSAAASNNRSMNAEIIATLEEKYPAPPEGLSEEHEAILREIPQDVLDEFILEYIERKGFTKEDIRNGVLPGVALREGQ